MNSTVRTRHGWLTGVWIIILTVVAAPCFGNVSTSGPGIIIELSDSISAEILPRVELLSGVLSHTTWINQRGPHDAGNHYYQALHEFLRPYHDHEAVRLAQTLTDRGFTYDAPPAFILHLSPLPGLEASYGYSHYLIQRAQGRVILDQFRDALHELAAASDFLSFFDSHRPLLEQTMQDSIADFNAVNITNWMEDFYGWTGDSFHLVFAPAMFPGGGYGASVQTDTGLDIFQVVRANGFGIERPGFPSGLSLTALTLHELSHSFVNPSVAANREIVTQYNFQGFYQQVQDIMRAQAYGNVETFINETLVRSVTTLALADLVDASLLDISIGTDRTRGFYLNDLVVHELYCYQQQRDLYPRFDDFLPVLADACADYRKTLLEHSHIPFTLADAVQDSRPPAFIVPTAEANSVDTENIRAYVQALRDAMAPEAPVFTDQEALTQDLSAYFVRCYGTLTGNRWITETLTDLPIVMEPNQVLADTTYPGTNHIFVSAWPDPYQYGAYVIIYTAQQAADIMQVHHIGEHLPTAYVLAGNDGILRAGFYTIPSSGRRRVPMDFERYPWRMAGTVEDQ